MTAFGKLVVQGLVLGLDKLNFSYNVLEEVFVAGYADDLVKVITEINGEVVQNTAQACAT